MNMGIQGAAKLLLFAVILTSGILAASGELKFIAKPWNTQGRAIRIAYNQDIMLIDCRTNEPKANVTLLVKELDQEEDAIKAFGTSHVTQRGQTFTLFVQISHRMKYICSAKYGTEEKKLVLGDLIVTPVIREVKPGLIPNENPFKVEMTGDRNVTCEAAGGGVPEKTALSWYKKEGNTEKKVDDTMVYNYGTTSTSGSYDSAKLMFKKADSKVAGTYVCVRDFAGKRTSVEVVVEIDDVKAPTVKLTEGKSLEVVKEYTTRVSATCSVDGSPRPKRNWYKDGKIVNSCPDLTAKECFLDIFNVTFPKDNGTYTCIAESPFGSASVSINVYVEVPVLLKKPSAVFLEGYDDTVDLYCEVEKSNPLPKIQWQTQAYSCEGSVKCKPDEGQWHSSLLGSVIFPDPNVVTKSSRLTVPARTYSEFFRCVADNGLGKDTYEMAVRRLEEKPAKLFISDIRSDVNEKENLTLVCLAQSNVFYRPYWIKNGKALPSGMNVSKSSKESMWGRQIFFSNLKISDSGNYSCIMENRRGGQRTLSKVIEVKALVKPAIDGFTNQKAIEKEKVATIMCNAVGNPPPKLSWTFNNKPVPVEPLLNKKGCEKSTGGLFFLQSDTRQLELIICKLDFEKHTGRYGCRAQSRLGTAVATKMLTVYGAPKILDWQPTYVYEVGTVIVLSCTTKGFPVPNATWHKVLPDGTTMPIPLVLADNHTAVAEVKTADTDAAGNYSCVSRNIYGTTAAYMTVLKGGTVVKQKGELPSSTIGGLVAVVLLVLLLSIIFIIWYRRRLEKKYAPYLAPNAAFRLNPDKTLLEQSSELPYDPDWEFPRDRLVFSKVLGSGAFGQVWLADAQGILAFSARDKSNLALKRRARLKRSLRYSSIGPYRKRKQSQAAGVPDDFMEKTQVAVKTLKEDASESDYKDLASELKILIHLGEHKNIVNLLGACTQSGKLSVIIEYCPHGNLLNFLRQRREIFEPVWFKNETDMENECTHADLTMCAYQIAKGMDFLASKKCVHRDLAARNILVGVDYIMKIADFGLARDIYKDEFYLKSTSGLLPVKWMAPESLFDKIYTEQSDVWSYGILLWEIFTLGGSPYPGLPTEELFAFLQDNKRMEQPEMCPLEVYAIMRDCWERSPSDRPLFSQVSDRLVSILNKHAGKDNAYVDFDEGSDHEPQETDYLVPENTMKKRPDDYLKYEDGAKLKDKSKHNGYDSDSNPLPPLPRSPPPHEDLRHPLLPPSYGAGSYIPMQYSGSYSGYSNVPSGGRRTESSISSNEVIV